MKTWKYLVGIGENEIGEEALQKSGFEYEKVNVGEKIRATINECLGAKYKNPTSMREDAPELFSCSSLISYLFTKAGVWMPSLAIDKYVFGTPIDESELRFGDLVFSNTGEGLIRRETVEWQKGTPVPEGVDHVGLYMDQGQVLHASKSNGDVRIENLSEAKNFKNIVGYRRLGNMSENRFVIIVPEDKPEFRNKDKMLEYLQSL